MKPVSLFLGALCMVPLALGKLGAKLYNCPARLPDEPCFVDDCYGMARWHNVGVYSKRDLSNTSVLAGPSEDEVDESVTSHENPFTCESLAIDKQSYRDCQESKPHFDILLANSSAFTSKSATNASMRKRGNISGRPPFPIPPVSEPWFQTEIFDTTCCRLTQKCFDYMYYWQSGKGSEELHRKGAKRILWEDKRTRDVWEGIWCCHALCGFSCAVGNEAARGWSMKPPKFYGPPPACVSW